MDTRTKSHPDTSNNFLISFYKLILTVILIHSPDKFFLQSMLFPVLKNLSADDLEIYLYQMTPGPGCSNYLTMLLMFP